MIGIRNTITLDSIEMSYLEYDPHLPTEHTPVLFLHGWGGSAESFQPLWEEILEKTEGVHMLAIDFPGFGESNDPPTPWTVSEYTACVVKFLDAIALSTVHIVSHSFGGRVTTQLAAHYPNRLETISYIAPAGIRHNTQKQETVRSISTLVKPLFALPILRSLYPFARKIVYRLLGSQDYLDVSGVMKQTFQLVVEEDLVELLERNQTPTHIYWGKNDSYVPVSDSTIMKEKIPQAEVTLFPDGRHGIHKTHASAIAKHLISFIQQTK